MDQTARLEGGTTSARMVQTEDTMPPAAAPEMALPRMRTSRRCTGTGQQRPVGTRALIKERERACARAVTTEPTMKAITLAIRMVLPARQM